MKRREFILSSSALLALTGLIPPLTAEASENKVTFTLLKSWGEGLLAQQINNPADKSTHGALWCPACDRIHGRCMDALYPFLYLYEHTQDKRFLNAALSVYGWAEHNVSQQDGSWTVMPNPKTWRGITVFGATALAEALKYHGDLLSASQKKAWLKRLEAAANYIYTEFNMNFTNINYGVSAIYALWLMGEVLHEEKFTVKSEQMASETENWLTKPNNLFFGEAKPSDKKSPKGLYGVDLGYNVEETLNGAVMYAVETQNEVLQNLLVKSLKGHVKFMLPDGGWDNSWGTRQYKWSYWGSRTTDGCQPAFLALAHKNPVFGRAAYQNMLLLKECTQNGLLYGGPHYNQHGIPPCNHHAFCHAKSLTTILNLNHNLNLFNKKTSLPRDENYGIKEFPELDVWLLNEGPWSATVSGYDFEYKSKVQAATGGALGLLYHKKVGLVFSASMAEYEQVEVFNQQELSGEDNYALTPRVEVFKEGKWFTNIFDREAQITKHNKNALLSKTKLVNNTQNSLPNSGISILHTANNNHFTIKVSAKGNIQEAKLVLPLISDSTETFTQVSEFEVHVKKKTGLLILTSNEKLNIETTSQKRVFNLVPGLEAIPVTIPFKKQLAVQLEVR